MKYFDFNNPTAEGYIGKFTGVVINGLNVAGYATKNDKGVSYIIAPDAYKVSKGNKYSSIVSLEKDTYADFEKALKKATSGEEIVIGTDPIADDIKFSWTFKAPTGTKNADGKVIDSRAAEELEKYNAGSVDKAIIGHVNISGPGWTVYNCALQAVYVNENGVEGTNIVVLPVTNKGDAFEVVNYPVTFGTKDSQFRTVVNGVAEMFVFQAGLLKR